MHLTNKETIRSDALTAPDHPGAAGAPAKEIEITSEIIEGGLVWLYAYNPETSDGRETVREIIKAALANLSLPYRGV